MLERSDTTMEALRRSIEKVLENGKKKKIVGERLKSNDPKKKRPTAGHLRPLAMTDFS